MYPRVLGEAAGRLRHARLHIAQGLFKLKISPALTRNEHAAPGAASAPHFDGNTMSTLRYWRGHAVQPKTGGK